MGLYGTALMYTRAYCQDFQGQHSHCISKIDIGIGPGGLGLPKYFLLLQSKRVLGLPSLLQFNPGERTSISCVEVENC